MNNHGWNNGRLYNYPNSNYSNYYPRFFDSNSSAWPTQLPPVGNINPLPVLYVDPFVQSVFQEIEEPDSTWRIDTAHFEGVPSSQPAPQSQDASMQQQLEMEQFCKGIRRYSQLWFVNSDKTVNNEEQLQHQPLLQPLLQSPNQLARNSNGIYNVTSNTTSNTTTTTTIHNAPQLPFEMKTNMKMDNGISQFSSDSPHSSPRKRRRDAMLPDMGKKQYDSSPPTSEEEKGNTKKKGGRYVWSPELHEVFEVAMEALGDLATAKNVMALMAAKGADITTLTRIRVANHMQYYLSRKNKALVSRLTSSTGSPPTLKESSQ